MKIATLLVVVIAVVLAAVWLPAAQDSRSAKTPARNEADKAPDAALACILDYQKKDAVFDAEKEARKPDPTFRSIFTNGVEAGFEAPGFPSRCSKPDFGQSFDGSGQWFEGVEEYIVNPGDSDSTAIQDECVQAKRDYAVSFNQRLGQDRPDLYRAACDANERASKLLSENPNGKP